MESILFFDSYFVDIALKLAEVLKRLKNIT